MIFYTAIQESLILQASLSPQRRFVHGFQKQNESEVEESRGPTVEALAKDICMMMLLDIIYSSQTLCMTCHDFQTVDMICNILLCILLESRVYGYYIRCDTLYIFTSVAIAVMLRGIYMTAKTLVCDMSCFFQNHCLKMAECTIVDIYQSVEQASRHVILKYSIPPSAQRGGWMFVAQL